MDGSSEEEVERGGRRRREEYRKEKAGEGSVSLAVVLWSSRSSSRPCINHQNQELTLRAVVVRRRLRLANAEKREGELMGGEGTKGKGRRQGNRVCPTPSLPRWFDFTSTCQCRTTGWRRYSKPSPNAPP